MKHKKTDSELMITFEEDLVSTSVKEYLNRCKEVLGQTQNLKKVVADIAKVKMIDSQGLNLLVGLYQECNKKKLSFQVTGTSPSLKRLFDFVKMSDRFGI